MSILLVISKYNEDISWTSKIKHKITIYDKSENPISNSIPLENIGRESNTFLYHISIFTTKRGLILDKISPYAKIETAL